MTCETRGTWLLDWNSDKSWWRCHTCMKHFSPLPMVSWTTGIGSKMTFTYFEEKTKAGRTPNQGAWSCRMWSKIYAIQERRRKADGKTQLLKKNAGEKGEQKNYKTEYSVTEYQTYGATRVAENILYKRRVVRKLRNNVFSCWHEHNKPIYSRGFLDTDQNVWSKKTRSHGFYSSLKYYITHCRPFAHK